ncbi:MAG: D-tyrosyl-tRNA(Tyr) deacylase [Clostridia bacterium]|nr:D-tyrosyl-tRNA(Tyr) deacylase [Clostridia bacterium]
MIAVIQRVSHASVSVEGQTVGKCGKGLCVLLGVAKDDSHEDSDALVRKILNLRIFSDDGGKMNLSVVDVRGEMLVISNFTLLAAYKKGNRPDYMGAAAPADAKELYEYFAECCKCFVPTECGIFGADMAVDIANDGPVTIVMDSRVLLGKA